VLWKPEFKSGTTIPPPGWNLKNTVEVEKGFKTEAVAGGKPTKPIPIDFSKVDRWFDKITPENSQKTLSPEKWAVVATVVIGGLIFIFFGIKTLLKRVRKKRK